MLARTKKRIAFTGGLLFLLLVCSILSCQLGPISFRSPAVSGTVVDAKTGQPLAGVKATVKWSVMRSTANMHDPEDMSLNSYVATTDSNGVFTVPAWGPVSLSWGWFYFSTDPEITFTPANGNFYQVYNRNHEGFNEIQPWPFQTVTFELPSWNGQKIPR